MSNNSFHLLYDDIYMALVSSVIYVIEGLKKKIRVKPTIVWKLEEMYLFLQSHSLLYK